MAALSVAGAQWRLRPEERTRLNTQLLPWALRTGSSCADLVCLYYEEHFHVGACWLYASILNVAICKLSP